ncbi:MAG: LamG domain-containing protein [Proteobacteria bacterium]|uniref:LamG domain-containing protein n=1 Tax=Candidatus Fonsibacter lacus TaxID=2576439 RepID=A0A964UZJ9_9PROT|nr:LamG domain-containing protein [Candidatus Fonsibacter lacus]NCU71659.1 LamG domain-containing protein [Candidatus Fonsibacter lacus]
MIGLNGGLLGAQRSTNTSTAPGVWTANEQALLKRASAWPLSGDPYFACNSLLLHMDGSNGSTTFADSSNNAFTVTANGNAQISTTQSKFGGASALFDGTGDYLVSATSATAFNLSDDWTIEFWVYPTLADAVERTYVHVNAGGAGGIHIHQNGLVLKVDNGLVADYASGNVLTLNQWQYITVVKKSTLIYVFLGGSLLNTRTAQSYASGDRCQIGRYSTGGTTSDFAGYLDDLRITKGIARYTANFTPPTGPFLDVSTGGDPYFATTSLLLHMDGSNGSTTFTDSSSGGLTVTPSGNAQISTAQSKFGGASAAFDGSGDYLKCTNGTAFDFGSSAFTIEFFVRLNTVAPQFQNLVDCRTSSGSTIAPIIVASYSNFQFDVGSSNAISASGVFSVDTWYHVAVCKSGTTTRAFINGEQKGLTYTDNNTYTNTSAVNIGRYEPANVSFLNGYIDELRITKAARYTANFTPPAAPFPNL